MPSTLLNAVGKFKLEGSKPDDFQPMSDKLAAKDGHKYQLILISS